MRRALNILAVGGLLATAANVVQAAPVTYQLDPDHTMVLFTWSHFGFSHPTAELGLGEGTLVFDEANPAQSKVQVTLPLTMLDTHVAALDTHLKKADFFNAEKYPTATYRSTRVEPRGSNHFTVTGNLTVHGVTKPVELEVTLNKVGPHPMSKQQSIGFDATGTLKRSDFGIGAYVPHVGDEITLHITTEGAVAK